MEVEMLKQIYAISFQLMYIFGATHSGNYTHFISVSLFVATGLLFGDK